MKKIWTLLVAAITVLALLTSGCGSSDKAAKPADGKKTTTIGFSISTPSSYPYVKALKKKQKNSESMLKSSMRKTIPQNRPMIFLT